MATMHDVARQAGVSLSTVSYALSGKRTISEATRQRVLDAVRDLNFHPNPHGRALASRRSNTIALVFPALLRGLSGEKLEFVSAAAAAAAAHGYAFLISISPDQDAEVVHLTRRGFTDGLILMEIMLHDRRVELLRERNYPFAMIGHCEDNTGISFVDLDFTTAVREAVTYLAGLGHRDIAFLGFTRELFDAGYGPDVRSRTGFETAIAELGLGGRWIHCAPTPRAGYEAVHTLLSETPECTAVLTGHNDAIGGMLQAAQERGRSIPSDLSILAIASARQAETLTPAITTMNFPAEEMGRLGAEYLIRLLEGGEAEPIHRLLRAELQVRQSTGPAPGVAIVP
jgi:DNA-binding LacI/PurR family transcriptional regulator